MSFEEFKIANRAAILDFEQNDFSNSESLCRSDATRQVLAQYDMASEEIL